VYNNWFSYHLPNGDGPFDKSHGAVAVTLTTGDHYPLALPSFTQKQIHGFGMSVVFLILFPFGAYWAAYLKWIPGKV